jgi:hypothetical protein
MTADEGDRIRTLAQAAEDAMASARVASANPAVDEVVLVAMLREAPRVDRPRTEEWEFVPGAWRTRRARDVSA